MKKIREYWYILAALAAVLAVVFAYIHRRVIWSRITGKPVESKCSRKRVRCCGKKKNRKK